MELFSKDCVCKECGHKDDCLTTTSCKLRTLKDLEKILPEMISCDNYVIGEVAGQN